jgi:hypothetical protein
MSESEEKKGKGWIERRREKGRRKGDLNKWVHP